MHIISPWTRGQKVFTEHADHVSQTLFVGRLFTSYQILMANPC